jgi:hypothetical protein
MQGLPGRGHIAIGRDELEQRGIMPKNDADVYAQMFKCRNSMRMSPW